MKKTNLILLIFLLISGISNAQFSYNNLIEKKKYSKIDKKIKKRYEKHPNDVSVNYDFSVLYIIRNYKTFNIDTAYSFAKKTKYLYLNTPDKKKLNKKLLNNKTITKQILTICKLAFNRSVKSNTIDSYNYFLKIYKEDKKLIEKAIKRRNKLAFDYANRQNTIKSYQNFIDTYPKSEEVSTAIKKRNALAFSKAKEKESVEAYQEFINTYPKASEVETAIELRDQLAFAKANSVKTSSAFKKFLSKYPNSKLYVNAVYERDKYIYFENIVNNNVLSHIDFINNNTSNKYKQAITDSLFYISKRQNNFQGLQYLLDASKNNNLSDSIWYYYYKVFTNDGYPTTYVKFKKLYKNVFPFSDLFNKDYKISLLITDLDLDKGYKKNLENKYKEYIKQASDKYLSYQILQMATKPYLDKKNWKAALKVIESYMPYFGSKNKYVNDLLELLKFSDKNIKRKNIGRNINTKTGGEYAPVIAADNKLLYFCGKGRKDNLSKEDIFVSKNINGYWQKAQLLSDLCTSGNDAPEHISVDGNKLLAFRNGDLYYSDQTNTGWNKLKAFPLPVNSKEWDADIKITSDGKAIIFSSRRKDINKGTGIDLIPFKNVDIYVCLKTNEGWSKPINLGPKINTRFTDRTPFLHSDMKTLYFSSNGHGGIGGLDVFKATRLNDTSWTQWSDPVNMGKEINTINNDWDYKVSTDGKLAYFAGVNNGKDDIYTIELPLYLRPGFVATISGKLLDKNNKPIESTIKWEDLGTGRLVGESKSNPNDGRFFIILPLGKVYGYFIDKDEYYPISNNIDLRTQNKAVEVENNIKMVTFKQMIDEGIAVPINNLFFNANKDKLLIESISELKRVAKIISTNNLKVEISGHTDTDGEEEYNQELSEKRANAAKKYLISLGVSRELMTTIGYGTTKPIANNDTEQGKAKNRRVELRFIQ